MKIQFRNTFSTTLPRMTQKGTQGRESASQKFFAAVVRNRGTADHEQSTRKFLEVAVTSLPWPSQGKSPMDGDRHESAQARSHGEARAQ